MNEKRLLSTDFMCEQCDTHKFFTEIRNILYFKVNCVFNSINLATLNPCDITIEQFVSLH